MDRPVLTLYGKPDCHLCDDALTALARLRSRYPHALRRVDITGDPALFERYRYRIPVLVVSDREYDAPLSAAKIEKALREAR